jgi:hypothetical protein
MRDSREIKKKLRITGALNCSFFMADFLLNVYTVLFGTVGEGDADIDRRKVCVNDKKASMKSIDSVKNGNKKQFKIGVEEI